MTTAWFISAFLEHGNLKYYLAETNGTTELALKLITDTARGLEYLHSLEPPVCHADIKPENILVTHQVTAVLADFGLAHLVEQHSGLTTVTTGNIRGSTRYMSPELFGDDDDPVHTLNSDMWAFGCVVFEVLMGKVPYPMLKNDAKVIKALLKGRSPAVPESLNLPGDHLVTLLQRCWDLDPASRPSASECLNMLLTKSDCGRDMLDAAERPEIVVKVESTWQSEEFVSITVSEDAKRAALVYDRFGELVVSLVDLEADVVTHELSKDDCESVQNVWQAIFSEDGKRIALVDDEYLIHIWEPFEPHIEEEKWKLPDAAEPGICYCGNLSILGYIPENQVYIWMTDLKYQLLWGHTILSTGIRVDADYPLANRPGQPAMPTIPNLEASAITISSDGRFLAVAHAAAPFDVQLWDIDQGCLLSRLEGHIIGARWLKFFADGNRLRSTAWNDSEMKIWDTSTLKSVQAPPERGFLRLDCPCILTFTSDTADIPDPWIWKTWRIASDCKWAAVTRGTGEVTFYNSKTKEKYSATVAYEVDPSAVAPKLPFNEVELAFTTATSGVIIGLTGNLPEPSTARAWRFEINDRNDSHPKSKPDPGALRATLDAVLWPLERLLVSKDELEMLETDVFGGGYGSIHKAKLKSNNQIVAVKCLRTSGKSEERLSVAIALARELRVWARLKHPNILRLEGYYLDPEMTTAWFISAFLEHGNLKYYLAETNGTTELALKLITDTARGLEYLHSLEPPVCHADIKPENILVTHQITAVLADFGLAHLVEQHSGLTTVTTGNIRGSTRYMSPELFGDDDDPVHTLNSDMWAFGCVVFEVLIGKVPYPMLKNDAKVIEALLKGRSPAVPESLNLPGDHLVTLLQRCWDLDSASRPSASECLNMLLTESDCGHDMLDAAERPEIVVNVESTWQAEGLFNVTVSEDAKYVALVYDCTGELVASLVELEAGVVTHELLKSDSDCIQRPWQAIFSEDGTQIALVDEDYMVHIWEPFEPRIIEEKWQLPAGVDNICYSGNLSILGYIDEHQVYIWVTDLKYQLLWGNNTVAGGIRVSADYPRANRVGQSPMPTIPNLEASAITISSDGRFLAVSLSAVPFDIQLWDIEQGCLLSRLEGHMIGARWLSFFANGNRLRSTAWSDLEMKIWDTSTLMSVEALPERGFLRLDCPCVMTFTLDTAHTPEPEIWKTWRIAPDSSWAAMTRGDGNVAFYNSKTREKYSVTVTYEVDPSDRAPEMLFNELELAFNAATSGVMIGMTDPALPNTASTVRAWRFEILQG
ncbi:hypothetical protein FRC04_009589 [Tulasnella sp. 424]|nr:hypothetical protein FRC04_009589 [Tulasnella sp. 424]